MCVCLFVCLIHISSNIFALFHELSICIWMIQLYVCVRINLLEQPKFSNEEEQLRISLLLFVVNPVVSIACNCTPCNWSIVACEWIRPKLSSCPEWWTQWNRFDSSLYYMSFDRTLALRLVDLTASLRPFVWSILRRFYSNETIATII